MFPIGQLQTQLIPPNATTTTTQQQQQQQQLSEKALSETLNVQGLDLDSLDQDSFVIKDDTPDNLLTASILQQFHTSPHISTIRAAFVGTPVSSFKLACFCFLNQPIFNIKQNNYSTFEQQLLCICSVNNKKRATNSTIEL